MQDNIRKLISRWESKDFENPKDDKDFWSAVDIVTELHIRDLKELFKDKLIIFKCDKCDKKYDCDGWEIGLEVRQGNNYQYKKVGKSLYHYTKCSCGNEVLLNNLGEIGR
jgi:hypothetical protein